MDPLSAVRIASFPTLDPATLAKGPSGLRGAPSATEMESLSPSGASVSATDGATGFEGMLKTFVSQVNDKQVAANDSVNGLLSGQEVPLHQAVIAMEEASVSFQLMVEMRNRLLESYQEMMRMQV